jgi:hypothetical protein
MGAFMKVAWLDLTKAATGGTCAWYGWALPLAAPFKASDPCLYGLFDLGKLATRISLLSSLDFAQKVSKSENEK